MRTIPLLAMLLTAACSAPLAPCECTDTTEYAQPDARELVKSTAEARARQLSNIGGTDCVPLTNVLPMAGPEDTAHVDCCLPTILLAPTCADIPAAVTSCDAYVVQAP